MGTVPQLEVLICTYGEDGIRRIARASHPQVEGVRWFVNWQMPEDVPARIPGEIEGRDDFKVAVHHDRGSSPNRNHALDLAEGELLLISDDDVTYTAEAMRGVIEAFRRRPECDLLCFRFENGTHHKMYPEFDLRHPVRGWYPSMVEIALRRKAVGGHRFNEHFGVCADFPAGEEELFVRGLLRAGVRGRFVPLTVCHHPGFSTGDRLPPLEMAHTKGAIFLKLFPATWPGRMLTHALRQPVGTRLAYVRQWLSGVRDARRKNVFR